MIQEAGSPPLYTLRGRADNQLIEEQKKSCLSQNKLSLSSPKTMSVRSSVGAAAHSAARSFRSSLPPERMWRGRDPSVRGYQPFPLGPPLPFQPLPLPSPLPLPRLPRRREGPPQSPPQPALDESLPQPWPPQSPPQPADWAAQPPPPPQRAPPPAPFWRLRVAAQAGRVVERAGVNVAAPALQPQLTHPELLRPTLARERCSTRPR